MPLRSVVSFLTARLSCHTSHTQPQTLAPCKGYGSAKFEWTLQDVARSENEYKLQGGSSCILSYDYLIRSVLLLSSEQALDYQGCILHLFTTTLTSRVYFTLRVRFAESSTDRRVSRWICGDTDGTLLMYPSVWWAFWVRCRQTRSSKVCDIYYVRTSKLLNLDDDSKFTGGKQITTIPPHHLITTFPDIDT